MTSNSSGRTCNALGASGIRRSRRYGAIHSLRRVAETIDWLTCRCACLWRAAIGYASGRGRGIIDLLSRERHLWHAKLLAVEERSLAIVIHARGACVPS
jgi:hypothetical protein